MDNDRTSVLRIQDDPREEILKRYFFSRMDAFTQWNPEKGEWQCIRAESPPNLVWSHLRGRITVATYPVNKLGNTPFVCYDLDSKGLEAYNLLEWLKEWFQGKDILFLFEETGGRGLHGWVLFLCYVPATKAIALANLAFDDYKTEVGPLPCPVEVFPKQAKPRDVGNPIRLPWGKHQSGNYSHFLNLGFKPDDEGAIEAIWNGKKVTEFDLDRILPEGAIRKAKGKKSQLVEPDERWGKVIPEGRRHNILVSLAGELRARKFSSDKLLAELRMHNQQRCQPPLDDEEVKQIVKGITEITFNEKQAESQADALVALATQHYLFHDSVGDSFAQFRNLDHHEIWPVQSRTYKEYLGYQFYTQYAKVPNSQAMNEALTTISGIAKFTGPTRDLKLRAAWHDGALWYDLSDEKWRTVRITRDGWHIVDDSPVLFRRYNHMLPQVEPIVGGGPLGFLEFVNLPNDNLACLLIVWIITSFIPDIPHPLLMPYGSFGSGKTVLCRFVRSLVDPSAIETLSFATDRAQFAQQLAHNYCAFYDNIHRLPPWVSDLLCRAVTGEGFSKRQLYTDDEDVTYRFRRVVGLNSLELVAEAPDLLDRAILLELEPFHDEMRKRESEIWAKFNEAKPEILGGIFDVLSLALGILPDIMIKLPRMADWAHYGSAIAEALPYGKAQFLQSYAEATRHQSLEALKANLVSQTLMAYMEDRKEFGDTIGNLLGALVAKAEALNIDIKSRGWPKAPNQLSKVLKGLKPNLAREGLAVLIKGHTKKGTMVTISNDGGKTSPSSPQIGVRGDDTNERVLTQPSFPESIVTRELGTGDDGDNESAIVGDSGNPLLELGMRLGYPHLEFASGLAIAEGEQSWQRFVQSASQEDIDKALAATDNQLITKEL